MENVRSLFRTSVSIRDPLVRDVLALSAASFVVGVSFGAIAVASGVSPVKTVAMSVFVFAGGAQFVAVGIAGAGGGAIAAVSAGLLLNVRHLPFGLAIGDLFRSRRATLLGSHLLIDESVAFALGQTDPAVRRRAYWLAGGALFVAWNVGGLIGAVAGRAAGDPAVFGVDAAFPAALLALVLPTLRQRPALRVAVGGAAVALATAPFLPPGLPVLAALLGLALALPVPGRRRTPGRSGS